MEHNWIFYKHYADAADEKSYYCDNCGMKKFTYMVKDNEGIKLYTAIEEVDFEYDYTCEEYLIKQIIE
jgi:predicted  nucleic acid-binding Zn-ribbon protein